MLDDLAAHRLAPTRGHRRDAYWDLVKPLTAPNHFGEKRNLFFAACVCFQAPKTRWVRSLRHAADNNQKYNTPKGDAAKRRDASREDRRCATQKNPMGTQKLSKDSQSPRGVIVTRAAINC
jgi:hypothetical protein